MIKRAAMLLAGSVILAGCSSIPLSSEEPLPTLQGPVPTIASTPTSQALRCLAQVGRPPGFDVRVAVGEIPDLTGRFDYDDLGAFITQGATNMMVSALGETGIPQVNRSSVGIAEWEMDQAINQRLGEGRPVQLGDQQVTFRPVQMGAITGSTHFVTGAVTELDFNVFQRAAEATIGGIGGGRRAFTAQISLDLLVTDTQTTEIVFSRPYRKQIFGYEIQAEVFRVFDLGEGIGQIEGNEIIDISFNDQPNEPFQGAVRWVVESAAYDLASAVLDSGTRCDEHLNPVQRDLRQDWLQRSGNMGLAPQPRPLPQTPVTDQDMQREVPAALGVDAPETTPAPRQHGPTQAGCRIIGGREVCPGD